MRNSKLLSVILIAAGVSGCSLQNDAEVYKVSAEPYSAFIEDDVRYKECRIELSDEVFISGSGAWFGTDGINISESGVYIISGNYNGCISVSTNEPVKLVFSGANIVNDSGYAVRSSSGRMVISAENGVSTLSGCGGEYMTAVCSEGEVMFSGIGSLAVDEGAYAAGGIRFARNINTVCQIIHSDQGDLILGSFRIN